MTLEVVSDPGLGGAIRASGRVLQDLLADAVLHEPALRGAADPIPSPE